MTFTNLKEVSVDRKDLLLFYADQLEPHPGHNVRDWDSIVMQERVMQMAESIFVNGVEDPIVVCPGPVDEDGTNHIYITSGETRWRGVKLLLSQGRVEGRGPLLEAKPSKSRNDIDLTIDLYLDNDQKNFSALELVEIFRRLERFGLNQQQIADRLGEKLHFVTSLWPLMRANHDLRQFINDEIVAPTAVCQAITVYGPEKAVEVINMKLEQERNRKVVEVEEAKRSLEEAQKLVEIEQNSENSVLPKISRPRTRGRPARTLSQKRLAKAKEELDKKEEALGSDRLTSSAILPDKDWRKHPNVTKLLVGLKYIGQWTTEQDMFEHVNTVLSSVGEDMVLSKMLQNNLEKEKVA